MDLSKAQAYSFTRSWLLRVVDVILIFFVWVFILFLLDYKWTNEYIPALCFSCIIFILASARFKLYTTSFKRDLTDGLFKLIEVWMSVLFLLLLLSYAIKISSLYSRLVVGLWLFYTPMCQWLARKAVFYLLARRKSGIFKFQNAIIIGATESGKKLAQDILKSPWLELELLGFMDSNYKEGEFVTQIKQDTEDKPTEDPNTPTHSMQQFPTLRAVADLTPESFRKIEKDIDVVFIAGDIEDKEKDDSMLEIQNIFKDTTCSVYWVPSIKDSKLLGGNYINLNGTAAISIYETPIKSGNAILKRIEDIILGIIILCIISIPLLFISLGVKLSSPGPVLFKQRRYGLDGKIIWVWKFRSMSVTEDSEKNIKQATKNDARVTKFGAFLRRTSLDELPQFFNVLTGSMSIVGPRPHAIAHNEHYRKIVDGYMLRHMIKPGVTGWAQVNGWRGETDTIEKMEKRVEFDIYYMRNWSIPFDLQIIMMTALSEFVGVGKKGDAY
ncbi:MAG: undecaprenyl-phosphate glucose phosphotransferase [Proteobacteria bacterium]|nr:undecaprenyl-phosphate glucose phosphotransferase [Pseudomonadota bacterium]